MMNIRAASILAFIALIAALFMFVSRPQSTPSIPTESQGSDRVFSEETPTYNISARYPKAPLGEEASQDANAAAASIIEKWIATTTAEFSAFAQNIPDEEKGYLAETGRKYELIISYIPYSSGSTRSLEFDVYMDTGGAHPNGFFRTFIFDATGQLLELSDLFRNGSPYLEKLSEISLAQVRAEVSERLGEDAGEVLFEEGMRPTAENFANAVLDNDALVILFPPYQVAPYAAGTFTVRIPFKDIENIIRPELLESLIHGETRSQ